MLISHVAYDMIHLNNSAQYTDDDIKVVFPSMFIRRHPLLEQLQHLGLHLTISVKRRKAVSTFISSLYM